MPNRIIRDAILSSEKMALLGWPEEVFYRRLMSIVDDYGRAEANLQLLRSRCYPLQTDLVRVADISRWMAACQKAGLILHYELEGKQYLEIVKFQQQTRSPSKWPSPTAVDSKCLQEIADEHLVVGVVEGGDDLEATSLRSVASPETAIAVSTAKPKTLSPPKRIRAREPAPTGAVWDAYAGAYFARYSADPVRNATVNGQLAHVVGRLGADDAPQVAGFYVRHNGQRYVREMHSVGLLLHHCEKLRTEWATNRTVTDTQARQIDRTQTLGNTFAELKEEGRNGTTG